MRMKFRCLSAVCDFHENHFLVKMATLNEFPMPLAKKLILQKVVFLLRVHWKCKYMRMLFRCLSAEFGCMARHGNFIYPMKMYNENGHSCLMKMLTMCASILRVWPRSVQWPRGMDRRWLMYAEISHCSHREASKMHGIPHGCVPYATAAFQRPRADLNRDRWIQSPEC